MHCVETAEFAALLAHHAAIILSDNQAYAGKELTRYWVESRARMEQWHEDLSHYHTIDADLRPFAMQAWWTNYQATLEEIMVTDILSRIVAALGLAIDQRRQQREIDPVTHSVFVSHLEARNRVFKLVLFGRGSSASQSLQLNRLRRAVERWIDRLLVPIVIIEPTARRYAIDFERLDANLQDYFEESSPDFRSLSDRLSRSAMGCTLRSRTKCKAAHPSYNDQVTDTVVSLLPASAFDSLGWFKSTKFAPFAKTTQLDAKLAAGHTLHSMLHNNPSRHPPLPSTARWLI